MVSIFLLFPSHLGPLPIFLESFWVHQIVSTSPSWSIVFFSSQAKSWYLSIFFFSFIFLAFFYFHSGTAIIIIIIIIVVVIIIIIIIIITIIIFIPWEFFTPPLANSLSQQFDWQ